MGTGAEALQSGLPHRKIPCLDCSRIFGSNPLVLFIVHPRGGEQDQRSQPRGPRVGKWCWVAASQPRTDISISALVESGALSSLCFLSAKSENVTVVASSRCIA